MIAAYLAQFCRWRASVAHQRQLGLLYSAVLPGCVGDIGAATSLRVRARKERERRDEWLELAKTFDPTAETA